MSAWCKRVRNISCGAGFSFVRLPALGPYETLDVWMEGEPPGVMDGYVSVLAGSVEEAAGARTQESSKGQHAISVVGKHSHKGCYED